MRKLLDIARRGSADEPEWHQVFEYETNDEGATVATALRELNRRTELFDVEGNPAAPIRWACSCLQKKCGSCAMVIDGVPQVACDARLAGFKGTTITLEPLRKFPVLVDLIVDRAAVFNRLKEAEAWLEEEVGLPTRRSEIAYEASRCLECGCCLEVCPNFSVEGSERGGFGGMAAMVPMSRLLAEVNGPQRKKLASTYIEAVYAGCGKSLACRKICPAGIDIGRLMSRSNAAAVWRRFG